LERNAILTPLACGKSEFRERSLADHAADPHLCVIAESGATSATSFWRNALAAMPPRIQWRYAAYFEAAERFERNLDFAIDLWGTAKRTLARSFAKVLRRSAGILELAARLVAPTR
jgi:hypothetical protein